MAWALRLSLAALILYSMTLLAVFIFQRSFIYAPDVRARSPEEVGLTDFQTVEISLGTRKLASWWTKPIERDQPVIIHFHGNGGALAGREPIYREIADSGFGVLAVGYPGYGGNPGSPSEAGFYATAKANYDWLIAQGVSPKNIVIIGQSIGTGPATWLATQFDAAGLVLEAPFTSLTDMSASQMPIFPTRWLLKDRFDSVSRIDEIDMPLVWIHGANDTLIPVALGQRVFDAAMEPKCAHIISKGEHNDLWQRGIGRLITQQAREMIAKRECVPGNPKI